ncbi:hypothetical protein JW890_09535 [candidate division WOR-3 bacterium]|nr:hypothetical protein [candidate division WOR-3 bacterium]
MILPIMVLLFSETFASLRLEQQNGYAELEIIHETSAYFRPSDSSRIFCGFQPGEVIQITALSGEGWMGFDPGVAQAANTGVFRYRWIKNDSCVSLKSSAENLLRMPSPAPLKVYNMFFSGTKIYIEPDSLSPPLYLTLNGDYAEIAGSTDGEWIEVNFSEGFPEIEVKGWIQNSFLNLSY